MLELPDVTYLIVALVLMLVLFVPAHTSRLGAVFHRLKGYFRPPDQPFEKLERWQWGCSTVLALVLHFCWFIPWVWYLKLPGSLFCEDPDEEGSGFWSYPPCPEPRALVEVVAVALPILGITFVSVATLRLVDVSPRRVDPLIYLYLGCGMAILSVIGCCLIAVVLNSGGGAT